MAKKKKEKVVEKTTEETKVNEPKGNKPKGDVTKVQEKMKMEPVDLSKKTITKVDLSKSPKTKEDANTEQKAADVVTDKQTEAVQEVVEEIPQEQNPVQDENTPAVEEITGEESKKQVEEVADIAGEAIKESMETGKPLPENIQKLVDFMEDTGGDLNDYVNLNKDYSELDNDSLLREYYKQTKPHLNTEEVEFLMEDNFSFDQDTDDEKEIRRKKLALKEQVANAKNHLDGLKSKYYEDIKAGSRLTQEQQKAIEFFNRYNEESEETNKALQKQSDIFTTKTNNVFDDKFKGFEYNVGDKKFRFNVKNASEVKESQSDINNFIKKFLNKDMYMEDATGYHKGLFTAMNSDAIANHFYEQGKADALKDSIAKSKNVDMEARQSHGESVNTSGIRVRALNDDGPDFKFKIKNK